MATNFHKQHPIINYLVPHLDITGDVDTATTLLLRNIKPSNRMLDVSELRCDIFSHFSSGGHV